ncbi:hypothetical protein BS47DRAFT_846979 [Hydnum rufescens UP504]|uniref:acylphosphatase n=1 Tax=Hydnum rufescens UP504 TaxID=1448309 RepID=A0A9P6B9E3_9AGAM|nr:hypothetical protein BS47DRAFT_846979 [Hydnum rufescens UP504]
MSFFAFEVDGLVQGVFFRKNTRKKAMTLGLRGWIRNHPAGHVEGVAIGPKYKLDELKEYLAHGPRGARVDKVTIVREGEGEGGEEVGGEFTIRR